MYTASFQKDIDAAWDEAVDALVATVPLNELPPYPESVFPEVSRTHAQAVREALANTAAGVTVAVPFCPPRQFHRVRTRVLVENPPFTLPEVGEVLRGDVVSYLGSVVDLPEGANIDEVSLTRRTVRSRVAATRFPPPLHREFAVLCGDRVVAKFPTQKEARAWALAELRASFHDSGVLDVVTLSRRVDGPLVRVERTPHTVKGSFKVTVTTPKTTTAQTCGWVFAWDDGSRDVSSER